MGKIIIFALVVSSLAVTTSSPVIEAQARTLTPIYADYDSELRDSNSHVDIDTMTARLKDLGVNTYFWLVWHKPTDWDDLKRFLPKAASEHMNVWVYLVPPSESGPLYSEPFRLDFLRWAEEIARLSIQYPNLKAWIVDDFGANLKLFTPDYLKQMQTKAKSINPNLAFFPLTYFEDINRQFLDQYRTIVDGVVTAYPRNRRALDDAWATLNDRDTITDTELKFPSQTPSSAGDFVMISQSVTVLTADRHRIVFSEQDDFTRATPGYHFKQVLVDGNVVWENDVAGGDRRMNDVTVDVEDFVRGKSKVALAFRLFDKKGVSNFPLHWNVRDVHADGLVLEADSAHASSWAVSRRGSFDVTLGTVVTGGRLFHVPFIVMTAADPSEFKIRYGEPVTPERIAESLRMSLQACKEGMCDGVVTYCLDKSNGSGSFPLARELFHQFNPIQATTPPKNK